MTIRLLAALALLAPGAALAQEAAGDPEAGAEHFANQCVSCHIVQNDAGEILAGRNGRVGPNLYGVVGRPVGSYPGFNYSTLMKAYAETGAVWGPENQPLYLQDPTGYLREATGQTSGRSKMAYQVRDEQEARDLEAYLATFSAVPAEGGAAAPAEGAAAPAEGGAATE